MKTTAPQLALSKWLVLLAVCLWSANGFSQPFIHPGLLNCSNELVLIRSNVLAGVQPWAEAWSSLTDTNSNPECSLSYQDAPLVNVGTNTADLDHMTTDGSAAYQDALIWYISGNTNYANKAIQILNDWSIFKSSGNSLYLSWAVPWYMNAAEILRYNNSGWTTANIQAFNTMVNNYMLPIMQNSTYVNNAMMTTIEGEIAAAIYLDNRSVFNSAVTRWRLWSSSYCYNSEDGPFPLLPIRNGIVEDYWGIAHFTNGVNFFNGQCQETGRDLVHTQMGMAGLYNGAQMAWEQGVDLFSESRKRFTDFMETTAGWMTGDTPIPPHFCDVGYINCADGSSAHAPCDKECWDILKSHYVDQMGMNLPISTPMTLSMRPCGQWATRDVKMETILFGNMPDLRGMTGKPPTISAIANQVVNAGGSTAPLMFSLADAVSPPDLLYVTGYCANTNLVPNANIVVSKPWSDTDLGPVGSGGYSAQCNTMEIMAKGTDIGGTADQGHFTYQPMSGNGSMTARVTFVLPTSPWSKAGVMMRASTNAGSANCAMLVSASSGVEFSSRITNNATTSTNVHSGAATCWVRLTKTGNNFAGYYAADNNGVPGTWVQVGPTVGISAMGTNLLSGLAGTAATSANGALSTFTVDNVSGNSNRLVTVTPAPFQYGQSTINLVVSDGLLTATNSFTITVPQPPSAYWNLAGGGSWAIAGDWTPVTVPNSAGALASLGGGGTVITAPSTVTLDGNQTVGTLIFNNSTNAFTLLSGGGGTLTLDNASSPPFIGDLVGNHTVAVPLALPSSGMSVNVSVASASSLALTGPISGSGGLTSVGNGALTLAGTNTYAGDTVISAGTLQLGDGTANTGSVAGNITDNASLIFANPGALTYSGVISGSGSLNKPNNPGVLTLAGANSYSGGTSITTSSGVINAVLAANSQALGTGSVAIGGGGNSDASCLELAGGITIANPLNGWASRNTASPNLVNVNGTNTLTSNLSGGSGGSQTTLESDSGDLVLLGNISTRQLNLQGAGKGELRGNLNLGANNLVMNGSGLWTLSGINAYTNSTIINGGSLFVDGTNGGGDTVLVNSGGTLGGRGTLTGPVTIGSGGTLAPGGIGMPGTLTLNKLTLSSGSTNNFEFKMTAPFTNDLVNVNNSGGLALNGGLVNLYASGTTAPFTWSGTYNLFHYAGALGGAIGNLAVANPQSGVSYSFGVSDGYVRVTINNSLSGSTNFWNVDASSSWATAVNWTSNAVPSAAGEVVGFGGGGTPITANRTVTLDGGKTVGGMIFSNGINGFTLNPGSGGMLTFDNTTNTAFIADQAGSHAVAVPLMLPAAGAGITVSEMAGSSLALNGVISGSGGLTITGAGALTLSGTNTYSGETLIATSLGANNTVLAANSQALGAGSISIGGGGNNDGSRLELAGGITIANNLNGWASRNTAAPNLLNVSGTNTLTSNLSAGSGGNQSTLESDGGDLVLLGNVSTRQLNLQGAGNGELQGNVSLGAYNLVMSGPGQWTLSGINTYTNSTIINGGTLVINGQNNGGDTVTVNNGGTLSGGGLLTGSVTVNSGGTFAPGAGLGGMRINSALTLNAGSTTAVQVNALASGNDFVQGLSSVNYGGTLQVTNLAGTLADGEIFLLFDAGSYAGAFAALSPATPGPGLRWDSSSLAVDGTLAVTSAPVPGIAQVAWQNGHLVLGATNGTPGMTLYVQATTNLSSSAGWTQISTNVFDNNGSLLWTNQFNPGIPATFYRLEAP